MHATAEQKVWIAFTHDEAEAIASNLRSAMEIANKLGSLFDLSDLVDEEMRLLHMRMMWAHALLCPAAGASPSEVLAKMPTVVMERVSLDVR